jgi:hypothetical protein
VDIVKILIGVGVGLIDEGVSGYSVKGVSAEDIARVGLFAAGLALDLLGRGGVREVGEALEIASAPLVTKTAVKYVKKKAYTPRIREARTPAPPPAPMPVVRGLTSY